MTDVLSIMRNTGLYAFMFAFPGIVQTSVCTFSIWKGIRAHAVTYIYGSWRRNKPNKTMTANPYHGFVGFVTFVGCVSWRNRLWSLYAAVYMTTCACDERAKDR